MTAELITRGLEAWHELQARAENAEQRAALNERSNELLTAENEGLRALLAKANAERDYYMRHTTELVTHLTNGVQLIDAAMDAARKGAYRPNGAVATDPVASNKGEPIPKFLQGGPGTLHWCPSCGVAVGEPHMPLCTYIGTVHNSGFGACADCGAELGTYHKPGCLLDPNARKTRTFGNPNREDQHG